MAKRHFHISFKPLAYLALWQFLMFFMLILLVWINELMDLPSLLFGATPTPPDLIGAYTISVGVLVVAIITVGHTYLQQRHIITGILKICSSCRRVMVNKERWEWVEEYIARHALALVTHGLCPACLRHEKTKLEERGNKRQASTDLLKDAVDDL